MISIKRKIFLILEGGNQPDALSRGFNTFIVTLITLNIIAVIIETVDSVYFAYDVFFEGFETFSAIVFIFEYLLRIWVVVYKTAYKNPVKGRLKYIFSPMGIIDLLAVMPFIITLFLNIDLRFITSLRLFRLFRIFKLSRYSEAMKTFSKVIEDKREELVLVFLSILFLLVFSSSIMYLIEKDAQPRVFTSIPATMWWGIATLTTVGYGDMYPITTIGKLLGGMIAMLGIGMFAIPAGLVASGFTEQLQIGRKRPKCPHCGKTIVSFKKNAESAIHEEHH